MYNVLGIQVNIHALAEGNNWFAVNTAELSAGYYTYRIVINGQLVKADKISVIR